MNDASSRNPAEVYDELFVPALFAPWGPVVAGEARIGPGDSVLDVACGTGALTCAVAEIVAAEGTVTGLDANPEMLEVARRKAVAVDWREGRAESLPFEAESFDAVVSQFGFMFFEDRRAALGEMMRVLRPGGRLAVAVCDAIDHSPGYAVLAELLQRLFGDEAAAALRAPFACGDRRLLAGLAAEAGLGEATVNRHDGSVTFDSIRALVSTERACIWTLGGLLDDDQFDRLAREAEESLAPFVVADGRIEFVMPVLIVTARKS